MADGDAEPRTCAFRWNAGGWFGAQIGATAWIALLGILLLFDAPLLGVLVLALAIAPNVVGTILWRMRKRIRTYPAVQALIVAAGLAGLMAIVSVDIAGRIPVRPRSSAYWSLLVYPFVMVVFHLRNRAARRHRGADGP